MNIQHPASGVDRTIQISIPWTREHGDDDKDDKEDDRDDKR